MGLLSCTFDTRFNGNLPFAFADITYNGYNVFGNFTAAGLDFRATLRDVSTNIIYPIIDATDPTKYTVTTTDGHGNALSASNTLYNDRNSTPNFIIKVKDPVTPSNPTALTITFAPLISGSALLLPLTFATTTATYALEFYLYKYFDLAFDAGFTHSPGTPTFPLGLNTFPKKIAGLSPDSIFADFGAGALAITTSQTNQQARRVGLLTSPDTTAHGAYYLYTESDGSRDSSQPQYAIKLPPNSTDTFTNTIYFGPSGQRARTVAKPFFDQWVALNPSISNHTDRRICTAAFPASWGNPLCVEYAYLYGLKQDGSSNAIYPPGSAIPSPANRGDQTAKFEDFRGRLLAFADFFIAKSLSVGAQCAFTWDIETDQPQAAIGSIINDPFTGIPELVGPYSIYSDNEFTARNYYIGDLRVAYFTTPALGYVSPHSVGGKTTLQEYFAKFPAANIEAGCTIRDQIYVPNNLYQPQQNEATAPDPNAVYTGGAIPQLVQTILDRIQHAIDNFGIRRFYIDTSVTLAKLHPSWTDLIKTVYPDVILYPEHFTSAIYRTFFPFVTLGDAGGTGTTQDVLDLYPNAGSLISAGYSDAGPITANQATLTTSVKNGDMLLVGEPLTAPGAADVAVQIYQNATFIASNVMGWMGPWMGGFGSTTTTVTIDPRGVGADLITLTWQDDTTGRIVVGGKIWITASTSPTPVESGPLITDSNGQVQVLLNDDSSYYWWGKAAGEQDVIARPITVHKD